MQFRRSVTHVAGRFCYLCSRLHNGGFVDAAVLLCFAGIGARSRGKRIVRSTRMSEGGSLHEVKSGAYAVSTLPIDRLAARLYALFARIQGAVGLPELAGVAVAARPVVRRGRLVLRECVVPHAMGDRPRCAHRTRYATRVDHEWAVGPREP